MAQSFLARLQQNHALEHATIAVLRGQGIDARLVGRATSGAFYIYGDVPTRAVEAATQEGLSRLQRGQADLAVSPLCGTNAVVAGVLAGLASVVAMKGNEGSLQKVPRVILAAMAAVVASQPVGSLVQRYLTTSSDLSGVYVKGVSRKGKGSRTRHKVQTGWESA